MARIGLIGAECTGKTTLLSLLKPHTKLPIIEELVREIVKDWGYAKPADVKDIVAAQRAYLDAQVKEQLRLIDFISDRTPLDNTAYMVKYAAGLMTPQQVSDFLAYAQLHTSYYDVLLYFPIQWDEVEDDGFRNTDAVQRADVQSVILELIESFRVRHLVYEVQTVTPSDRLNEILNELNRRHLRL